MKKILLTIAISIFAVYAFSQGKLIKEKNEYIYFGVKVGTLNNVSLPLKENNYVLLKTPYGDLLKTAALPFTLSPSAMGSINLHFDSKNDRRGIVSGLSFKVYSFSNVYRPQNKDLNYKLTRTFSAVTVSVPIYAKFNFVNIYKNQSYFTFGFYYNLYLFVYDKQKASWSGQKYIGLLPGADLHRSSLSAMFGYNYKIFYISFEYLLQNFMNKNYQMQTQEGIVMPYADINPTNNLYVQLGVNIPMTRWLTARSWTAEQIRRFFKPKR